MRIQAPSGVWYEEEDINIIREMARVKFVDYRDRPFELSTGIESHTYVLGREDLTDNPNLELSLGCRIAELVYTHSPADNRQPCLIGLPTAGAPLAQAGAMASLIMRQSRAPSEQRLIAHRIMREVRKEHGAHKSWVNGKPELVKQRYWIVENATTSGNSVMRAVPKLVEDGYPGFHMPVLIAVDRQQGAVERLKNAGFQEVHVLFNLLDLTFAFGELELWPKSAVKAVEEEIAAHQFAA